MKEAMQILIDGLKELKGIDAIEAGLINNLVQVAEIAKQEHVVWAEFVDRACGLIKAADDAAAENDYMLDSDNCISVLRGTWKGNYLNDYPQPKVKQEQGEPAFYKHPDGHLMTPERAKFLNFDLSELLALYTTPQQRKPLTDDEFTTAIEVEGIPVEDVELVWAIKDLVEAAHGITKGAA